MIAALLHLSLELNAAIFPLITYAPCRKCLTLYDNRLMGLTCASHSFPASGNVFRDVNLNEAAHTGRSTLVCNTEHEGIVAGLPHRPVRAKMPRA